MGGLLTLPSFLGLFPQINVQYLEIRQRIITEFHHALRTLKELCKVSKSSKTQILQTIMKLENLHVSHELVDYRLKEAIGTITKQIHDGSFLKANFNTYKLLVA